MLLIFHQPLNVIIIFLGEVYAHDLLFHVQICVTTTAIKVQYCSVMLGNSWCYLCLVVPFLPSRNAGNPDRFSISIIFPFHHPLLPCSQYLWGQIFSEMPIWSFSVFPLWGIEFFDPVNHEGPQLSVIDTARSKVSSV